MQALLIVAHGSRRTQSNDEIRALAAKVGEQSAETYGYVCSAFLELAEPSIPDGIQQCIDAKQGENPQVRVRMAPYLGVSGLMPSLFLQAAETACDCQGGANCTYPACITG